MRVVAARHAADDLLHLLRCPSCDATLTRARSDRGEALECIGCRRRAPVVDGVPRFVEHELDDTARRTQASFGYEWSVFADWRQSGAANFDDYFRGFELSSLHGAVVLDAGCGMGRHARHVAPFARRVVAVDFSSAIDQAAKNTADCRNVDCVQADILALPFADEAFDVVYSLGVLHHLADTERALAGLVRKLKPGGRLRIYLYWKRHGWSGVILRGVTLSRHVTTRLPFPVLRGFCGILSAGLYAGVVLPFRALARVGMRRQERWPLFVYTKYPFTVLYNDQFDRFSAPLEKRYDAGEVCDLLCRAGLRDVRVTPCFGWVADGIKPQ